MVSCDRGKRAQLQATINNTEEGVGRRQGLKPGGRGTPKRSKIRQQSPEKLASTPGGNPSELSGVIRVRGGWARLGRARDRWRRRRGGITAIGKQHKAVQSELHQARLRLMLRLLLPLPPPQDHASKPPHAVSHGFHSRQADNAPHTSVHAVWGPSQPDVSKGQGTRGRCWC